MQRERRYRSKLLYLVRTSLEACVAPQAECMQVVWGPWKLRTLLGMGITGMGGLLEPGRSDWRRPLRALTSASQLASSAQTIRLNQEPQDDIYLLVYPPGLRRSPVHTPSQPFLLNGTGSCEDMTMIKHTRSKLSGSAGLGMQQFNKSSIEEQCVTHVWMH